MPNVQINVASTLTDKLEHLVASGAPTVNLRSFQRDLVRFERRQQALYALMQASSDISRVASELDLHHLIEFVLDKALSLVGAERGLIVLQDEDGSREWASQQPSAEGMSDDHTLDRSLLQQVTEQGEAVVTTNAQRNQGRAEQQSLYALSLRSVMAVPLTGSSDILGALYLDTPIATRVFEDADLQIVNAFAGITASAIELIRVLDTQRELYLESVKALVSAVEAKDAYTAGHSSRVGLYAQAIYRVLGKSESEAEQALIAGYLHDVGKIGINDAYVNKAGPLTDLEWQDFKTHTVIGERILSHTKALGPILPAVRWHHEKLDGSGYPDGLKGDAIPLMARVICVADSFDAMTTDRPYRASPGKDFALEELRKCVNSQFDPDVVDALEQAFLRRTVPFMGKG